MKPRLSLARKPQPKPAVPYSLLRQAVALFRNPLVPRATRRHNARAWIRSVLMLGDKHLLRGGAHKWGQPGEPNVPQVHAPRTLRAALEK